MPQLPHGKEIDGRRKVNEQMPLVDRPIKPVFVCKCCCLVGFSGMKGVSTACAKRGSGASSRETECPAWRNVSHWPLLLPQESVQSLEWQHASPFHDRSAMRVRFHLVIDKIDSRIAFKGASEMAKPMQS